MHDIEPHHLWRDKYIASEDEHSPFHGREYSEFSFTNKIYNYYIHPQWDEFGSSTLYIKILFTDYEEGYTIFELIGEWNDCLKNDIMFLKREIIDILSPKGIHKYILICENVLNFHGSDDCYYEEWYEDIAEESGWIILVNSFKHVEDELKETRLQQYLNFGGIFNDIIWRPHKPKQLYAALEAVLNGEVKRLDY